MQSALRKLRPTVARRVRPAAGAPPPPAGASDAGARPGGPTGFRLWREELCGVRETGGAVGGRAGDTAGRGGSGAAELRTETGLHTETGPVRVGYLSADFGNHPTLDLLFAALARHAASDADFQVGCRAPASLRFASCFINTPPPDPPFATVPGMRLVTAPTRSSTQDSTAHAGVLLRTRRRRRRRCPARRGAPRAARRPLCRIPRREQRPALRAGPSSTPRKRGLYA